MMDTMQVSPAAVLEYISSPSSGGNNGRSGGRIVIRKEDVINYLEARGSGSAPAANNTVAAPSAKPAAAVTSSAGAAQSSGYTDIPNNNIRKVIAKRLTESKVTVPHAYTTMECNIDAIVDLRKVLKKEFDLNISVNDLVIRAAALALRDVPEANARWDPQAGAARANPQVDISVAVATPTGLITPIVFGADRRGVRDINNAVKDLATRAKEGKLKPEEFQGGTFTISNLGMFGISEFSAVINPPQACILAVGGGISRIAAPTEAAAASGDLPVETTMTVQLSSDRRVLDDATAARFLQTFRSYIVNPRKMML
jgi:pyruvate dehydrogenase E2 component (dihydrolipoamide acetyltransferase)